VGIGTGSPSQSWTGGSAHVVQIEGVSSQITALRINESGDVNGDLQLISGASNEVGIFNFNNGPMRIGTNGTERLRIDSSGNVIFGKTAANNTTAGTTIYNDNGISVVRDDNPTAIFNRLTSDGDIAQFRKDGTTVGSIGSSNGAERLYMVNDSTGLSFLGDFSKILPCDSAGAPRDAAIDLGQGSGGRFKDLHLSGTANVDGLVKTPYVSLGSTGNSYQTVTGSSNGNDLTYRAYQNHIFKNSTGASSSTDGTERMRIDSSGKIGINTTSANTRLQVSGNSANQLATYFCVEGTYPVVYYRDTEVNQNSFATYCDGGSFFIQSVPYANRNDANPSSSFQTGVYLSSNSGSWGSTSDENLKTNLVPIENGLAKVNTLRSVIGEFIDDAASKRSPFLIAQDVQAVLPEAVETIVKKVTDENGEEGSSSHLGLQYTAVIPLLVAAIKELSDKNDALETQNATFDARLTALEGAAP